MNKIISTGVASVLMLSFAASAFASVTTPKPMNAPSVPPVTDRAVTVPVKAHTMGKNKTLQGIVKSISGSTLTLTVDATDYTVDASAAKVLNRPRHVITLTDLTVGDKVRVFGMVTDTSIAAKIVRDISLPMPKVAPKPPAHTGTTTRSH